MYQGRLLSLATLAVAACTACPFSSRASSGGVYDYIVVGGGTTGLVVANRLTENPNITVLVVEAGGSAYDNPEVYDTDGYGEDLGTAIDWNFTTVPQSYGGNQQLKLHAGKAIGGTSTLNGDIALTEMRKMILTFSRNVVYPSRRCADRCMVSTRQRWLELDDSVPLLSEKRVLRSSHCSYDECWRFLCSILPWLLGSSQNWIRLCHGQRQFTPCL